MKTECSSDASQQTTEIAKALKGVKTLNFTADSVKELQALAKQIKPADAKCILCDSVGSRD